MIVRMREANGFNLRMVLEINEELEYIELLVSTRNKPKHTCITKQFKANDFKSALAYYRQQEEFLFGTKEA